LNIEVFLTMRLTCGIYLILGLLLCLVAAAKGDDNEEFSRLKEFRKFMLNEVNFVRTRPAEYAETRLRINKENFSDNGAYAYLRKIKPVKALALHEILNSTALDYAKLMARKNTFSHVANGTPFERAKKAGYRYSAMGENIACGNDSHYNAMIDPESSAIEFVKMLIIDRDIKDVGHRITLLNPVYRSVGFGFARNPSSTCVNYIVQDFGSP
jgi:uncharacterized protein YkwD